MFEPTDRSVLLDLLRPPPGFTLDTAVATTFTLDLTAALVVPLAFTAFNEHAKSDPIALLESVRAASERFTVFCQSGSVKVPNTAPGLFGFLEPVVHEVKRPRPGRLFHPKLWLLRYRDGAEESVRMLVPTRNLTLDASWDAVLRLDGTPTGRHRAMNRPLAELIEWCTAHTTRSIGTARAASITSLVESVRRTEWDLPDGVNEMKFYALGIGAGRDRPEFSGNRHLVISPFVNEAGLDIVAPHNETILISRPEQMAQLPRDMLDDLDCRLFSAVDDSELAGSDEADGSSEQATASADDQGAFGDLHAKIIITEAGNQARLCVGSANATDAAFGGNVEIVVELQGGRKALGIDTTLNALKKVVEPCEPSGGEAPSDADVLQRKVDNLLRDFATAQLTLTAAAAEHGLWSLRLLGDLRFSATDDLRVTAEVLSRPGYAIEADSEGRLDGPFHGVPLADISAFVVLRAELTVGGLSAKGAAVVRAELVNEPSDRLDAVIARQVDSPEKFLRFLFLMLSLAGGGLPPWLIEVQRGDGVGGSAAFDLVDIGVFEALARALATSPNALADVARLVERLRSTDKGRAVLPEGFDELWVAFTDARELLAEVSR